MVQKWPRVTKLVSSVVVNVRAKRQPEAGSMRILCPRIVFYRFSFVRLILQTYELFRQYKLLDDKAHIWYERTSHRFISAGTKVMVICQGQSNMKVIFEKKKNDYRGISVSHCYQLQITIDSFLSVQRVGQTPAHLITPR